MQPVRASKCIVKMYCSSKPYQLSQLRLKIFERERMLLFLLLPPPSFCSFAGCYGHGQLLLLWSLPGCRPLWFWHYYYYYYYFYYYYYYYFYFYFYFYYYYYYYYYYCCATAVLLTFSSTFLTCIMSLFLFLGWGLLKVEWFQIRVLYYSRSR